MLQIIHGVKSLSINQILFSPKYHGNSYLEFLRRTKNLKEHIIIIKDNFENIFGAYVE